MAADTEMDLNTEKPCCAKRKERYLKLKESRDCLRSALLAFEPRMIELEKAREAERARAELEKESKEKESVARAGLEKVILGLKSDIASLQKSRAASEEDGERVLQLQTTISELEGETCRLKEILEEERQKGDLEKKTIEAEKKNVEKAFEDEKEEKSRESAVRAGLENEIINLKFEIDSLKSKGTIGQDEIGEEMLLLTRVSEAESENSRLNELLENERKNWDMQMKKLQAERERAEEALKSEVQVRSQDNSIRTCASLKKSNEKIGQHEGGEQILLRNRVSELEEEINRLGKRLGKERENGDLQKKGIQSEKGKVEEAWKLEIEARSKEYSVRTGLENEILDLKSEIASLVAERASNNEDESREIILLQTRVSEAEAESSRLKELFDQEKKRADSEKKKAKAKKKKIETWKLETEAKLKESAGLENEILKLKSEIALFQKKMSLREQDEGKEALLLRSRVSEGETEIQRLNELLEKERSRGNLEKNRAEAEKKKASEALKIVTFEKNKAKEESRLADVQRSCFEKCRLNLEASQAEVNELRAELASERSRTEEADKMLEAEKQITTREKKHAESEMARVEEQKKNLMDEKNRADCLSQKLEEAKQKIELLEKDIMLSKNMKEAHPVTSDTRKNLMLLEKQLKLEKMHVKHAKRVARFEKVRNNLLEQELLRLKQKIFDFARSLNVLDDCFPNGIEGIDASAKINESLRLQCTNENNRLSGKEKCSLYGISADELVKARYTSMECHDRFRSTVKCSTPLSDGSGSSTKPISGISSTMESLIGGSDRIKLQNSAIYSTSTSFSDRQSVGSQGNTILSVSRPDNVIENLKWGQIAPRLSTESSKHKTNGNLGLVAENTLRPPVHRDMDNPCFNLNEHGGIKVVGRDGALKRKRLPDELASIECLCSELKNFATQIQEKVSAVNDSLILENDKPEGIYSQINGKLNASGAERFPIALLLDDIRANNYIPSKKRKVSQTHNDVLKPASKEDVSEVTDNLEREATKDAGVLDQEMPPAIMTSEDIMKLLDLDDPDQEERFRMAMEMPLSPTLPEIEGPTMEAFEVSDSLISEGICRTMENESDNRVMSGPFDVINGEMDSCKVKGSSSSNTHGSSSHQLEGSDFIIVEPQDKDVDFHNLQVSKNSTENEAKQASRSEVMEVLYANNERQQHQSVSMNIVAFHDIDKNGISRIVSAFESCISSACTVSQKVWMVEEILVALARNSGLLSKEKACVFFSLLLHNFLMVTSVNFRKFYADDIRSCSDSFLSHLKTVMSDAGTRNILLELFQLETLLGLIESFLVDKAVMVYNDGKSILLSSKAATTDELVAGSFILAAICATTGHIGFVCESSYKLLQMHRYDSFMMLRVLHVFASVCGSKYFTLNSHNLIMAVVRSIVTVLERENVAINATCGSYVHNGRESRDRFPSCVHCLFSEGIASVDEVLSLILEKLQHCAVTIIEHQPSTDVSDIISLVELISQYMSWDWTLSNIIPQVLKIVESCLSEKVSAAIILLIGQLGRSVIKDGGCEQPRVEELRCSLAGLLDQTATRNWGIPTQLAIVHALSGILSVNLGELAANEELPADSSQNIYVNRLRTWLSQLSEDLKSLAVSLDQLTT